MTTVSFEIDAVDDAVVTLLKSISNIDTYEGSVPTSPADGENVLSVPLPYLLFSSGLGRSTSPRAGGALDRTPSFSLSFVHSSFRGAKAVGLGMREFLNGAAVTIEGRLCHIRLDEPTESDVVVSKDPTWSRPGGQPLFFGVDRFNIF